MDLEESEKHCQEQFVGSLGHLLSKEWLTSVKGCIVTLHRKTARTETLPDSRKPPNVVSPRDIYLCEGKIVLNQNGIVPQQGENIVFPHELNGSDRDSLVLKVQAALEKEKAEMVTLNLRTLCMHPGPVTEQNMPVLPEDIVNNSDVCTEESTAQVSTSKTYGEDGGAPNVDSDRDSMYSSCLSIATTISSEAAQNLEDTYSLLAEDPVFHDALEMVKELMECIVSCLSTRDDTIVALEKIKKAIEKSYHKRTISKVAGASAAIVGSSVAVVGFGLSFVTLGASLSLSIVGGVIAAAGGVTMAGADIGDIVKSKSKMKEVEAIINKDRALSTTVHDLCEKISKQISDLRIKYPTLTEENILSLVSGILKGEKSGKVVYDGCKLVDIGVSVVSSIVRAGRLVRGGAGAARIAWTGLKTVAGGLSVAGVVFDAVSVPFDIFVLVKGSYDIHKYRSGRGSNSNKATEIETLIKQLEEHKEELLRVQQLFVLDDSDDVQPD